MTRLLVGLAMLALAWIAMIVALIVTTPASAMEATADGFRLRPDELARCQAGGGCIVIPFAEMESRAGEVDEAGV